MSNVVFSPSLADIRAQNPDTYQKTALYHYLYTDQRHETIARGLSDSKCRENYQKCLSWWADERFLRATNGGSGGGSNGGQKFDPSYDGRRFGSSSQYHR